MAKEKKDSKRVKISMKDILKPGLPEGFKPIDMSKVYEEDKKKVEADKIRYKNDLKKEGERFDNLSCPCCKNTNKKRNIISHMNSPVVYGGRNSSTVHADYLICQNCGIMYVDLNKKEINPPYEGLFSSKSLGGRFRC
jgi:hypothetical protein